MDCACSMGAGSMMWMMLVPAMLVAAIVVGGILLLRRLWASPPTPTSTARGILDERYARGEIARDEYLERRGQLDI